jgi:hypothetical protein
MRLIPLLVSLAAVLPAVAADDAWVADARAVATSMPPRLLAVLTDAMNQGGPEGAIGVCREKAPQLAQTASAESGWQIRRVSLRNRNPKAEPDAWERAALADFDRRAEAGESPATLERAEIVPDNGRPTYRYLRALPTQPMCLSCHGARENLSPAVAAKLHEFYPDDRALGYRPGQIRGAMTLKKQLP